MDAGPLLPRLRDAELIAQTLWAAANGVAALEFALAGDPWVDFRLYKKRYQSMLQTMLHGIARATSVT